MGKDKSVTPRAVVTLAQLGPGFSKNHATVGATSTLKLKRDKLSSSLAFTDGTLKNIKSLRDVIATVDYKLPKGVTLNSKYELGTKKYAAGATWDGTLGSKGTSLKMFYTNKDKLVAGEATINVRRNQKLNTTFNQKQLLTAKYTLTKGDYTLEPAYSFIRQAPILAVTRKMSAKDTVRLSYDVKSEAAAAEWNRKPYKMVLSSGVSKKLQVGKPTLSATYENIFEF